MLLYCTDIDNVTEEQYLTFLNTLNDSRRKKAERYKKYSDRVLSASSYVLLMYALHLNGDDGEHTILCNEHGKPFFENSNIHFNISHTEGAVACVVQNMPVGVDIQKKVEKFESVMRRVCTEEEKKSVMSADDPQMEFTTLWTLKESILKCIGTGIAGQMKNYDFSENKTENGKFKLVSLYDDDIVLSACSTEPIVKVEKITVLELFEYCKSNMMKK